MAGKVRHKEKKDEDVDELKKQVVYKDQHVEIKHKFATWSIVLMTIYTTFYKIWYPEQVVFDEVHFGKFAGYYLQRAYFFDVHPPLAKLMYAAIGYLVGFDGVYKFSNIGESYASFNVPYIPFRVLPAFLHVLSILLTYHTLKESGYSILTCFMISSLYLFDNSFIAQNRLILLDSILIFYMLLSIYSYIRFRKLRHCPFTPSWWKWLFATGVSMALTISVKMVGLFIFVAVGLMVIQDLWNMLDIQKSKISHKTFLHYFGAHIIGLILTPICVYMFWFYIHFSILIYAGPGDNFMSSRFQNSLENNNLGLNSLEIMYNQSIRLQHTDTRQFLNANGLSYPAQYQDGRFSSRGLQVTGILKPEFTSYWRIKPGYGEVDQVKVPVRHNDLIRLEHILTGQDLLTHDVASPWMPTNQEFTLNSNPAKVNDTIFRVILDSPKESDIWSTWMNKVKLIHLNTNVALWCSGRALPEWGNHQLEINGNKKYKEDVNYWVATDILGLNATQINLEKNLDKQITKLGFFEKFYELHQVMFFHNSRLISPHPYQSRPMSWPLMLRGISYWSKDNINSQIYMTGNVVGWWVGFASVFIFIGTSLVSMILERRQIYPISKAKSNRLNRNGGFFLLLWAVHYLPFFLMGRSLYLHHYLPAMACNYLLMGALFEYLFVDGVISPVSYQPNNKSYSITNCKTNIKSYIVAFILISMQFMVYLFLSPITYGTPGLTNEEATRRKILESWDVRYAKFIPMQQ